MSSPTVNQCSPTPSSAPFCRCYRWIPVLLVDVHSMDLKPFMSFIFLACFIQHSFTFSWVFVVYPAWCQPWREVYRRWKKSPLSWGSYVLLERKRMAIKYSWHNHPLHEDGPDSMAASQLPKNWDTGECERAQSRVWSAKGGFVVGHELGWTTSYWQQGNWKESAEAC